MQPENNQYFPPLDYLDQIAPKSVKQPNFIQRKPIVFAVILLIVAFFSMTLIGVLTPNKTKPTQQLAARLITTKEVTEDSAKKIKSNQLRAINSNLKTNLLNMVNNITTLLAEQKININKLDKKILTSESNVDLLKTLEEARLNAVYDQTYTREMVYRISTILSLMDRINDDTNSKSMKDFINDATKNLEAIKKQLSEFDFSTY
ncbi:MAG: hypothetical protein PHO93_02370 [Candidatus Saccharimonadaceae bacterium]|nr:hypothetical protein [Candidatus Saccharimonadaceae bacterium]